MVLCDVTDGCDAVNVIQNVICQVISNISINDVTVDDPTSLFIVRGKCVTCMLCVSVLSNQNEMVGALNESTF